MRSRFENHIFKIVVISLVVVVSVCVLCEATITTEEKEEAVDAFWKIYSEHEGGILGDKVQLLDMFAHYVATSLADTDPKLIGAKENEITVIEPTLSMAKHNYTNGEVRVIYFPFRADLKLKDSISGHKNFINDEILNKYNILGMAADSYAVRIVTDFATLYPLWYFLVVTMAMPSKQDRAYASRLHLEVLQSLNISDERKDFDNFEVDKKIWNYATMAANKTCKDKKLSNGFVVAFANVDHSQIVNNLLKDVNTQYPFQDTDRIAISVALCRERSYANDKWVIGRLYIVLMVTTRPAGIDKITTSAVLDDLAKINLGLGKYNDLATEIAEYMAHYCNIDIAAMTLNVAVGAKAFILPVPENWFKEEWSLDECPSKALFQKQFLTQFLNDGSKEGILGSGLDLMVLEDDLKVKHCQLIIVVLHEEEVLPGFPKWAPKRDNSNAQAMVLVGEWQRMESRKPASTKIAIAETPSTQTPLTEAPSSQTTPTQSTFTETLLTKTPPAETQPAETPLPQTLSTEIPVTETPSTQPTSTETEYTETAFTEFARGKVNCSTIANVEDLTKDPAGKFLAMAMDSDGHLFYIQCEKSSPYFP